MQREVPPSRLSPGSRSTPLGHLGGLGASGTASAEGRAPAGDRLTLRSPLPRLGERPSSGRADIDLRGSTLS